MTRVERRDKESQGKGPQQQREGGFKVSRRDFIVGSGAGAAGLVVGGVVGREVLGKPAVSPPATTAAQEAPAAATQEAPPAEEAMQVAAEGWGKEDYPYPAAEAFIECNEMKCVGCGICEMACSYQHFGVINKSLARIQVRKYLLPLPKAVQTTCSQCQEEERECQAACPVEEGPAIYYDKELKHMVVNEDACLGEKCDQCLEACPAGAVRRQVAQSPYPFVCDLCDTEGTGERDPQCVSVCPTGALYFKNMSPRHLWRKHPDDKADLIARRLYPLPKDVTLELREA